MTERKIMLTSPGSYRNPTERHCWEVCSSCGRCENRFKGVNNSACNGCSGRYDPKGMRHPDRDDECRCKEGLLSWTTQEGQSVKIRFLSDPFKKVVKYETQTQDERDWNDYLNDARERLDDEHYDPIVFDDGTSTQKYFDSQQNGNKGV